MFPACVVDVLCVPICVHAYLVWERRSVSRTCLCVSLSVCVCVAVSVCCWVCELCRVLETVGVSVYVYLYRGLGVGVVLVFVFCTCGKVLLASRYL